MQPSIGGGRSDTEEGFRSKTFSVSRGGIPRSAFFQNAKVLRIWDFLLDLFGQKDSGVHCDGSLLQRHHRIDVNSFDFRKIHHQLREP